MSDQHGNNNDSNELDNFVALNQEVISGLQDQFGANMRVCVGRGPMMGVVTSSPEHEAYDPPMGYNRHGYHRYHRYHRYRRYRRHGGYNRH